MVFIIRATLDSAGLVQGVVLVPASGRKEAFTDAGHLGALITTLAAQEAGAGRGSGLCRLDEL